MRIGVIPAGGCGYRLGPHYKSIQKCLLAIEKNKPIVEFIIDGMFEVGCDVIYLIGGHEHLKLLDFINQKADPRIKYIHGHSIGTAHALLKLKDYIHEPFLYSSGDILYKFDIIDKLKRDFKKSTLGAIAISENIVAPTHPKTLINKDRHIKDIYFVTENRPNNFSFCTLEMGLFSPKIFTYLAQLNNSDMVTLALYNGIMNSEVLIGSIYNGEWFHIANENEYIYLRDNIENIKTLLEYNER